ncbi:MAG: family 16 glycosylhydrolase, partial [Bacteroidia bacterium]
MIKCITLLLAVLSYLSASACSKLVWADEFDYEGRPDAKLWGYDIGGDGWGNNEEQFYTNRLENAFVKDGHLTIRALKETYQNRSYTSARLVTKNKGDWKYGRFEIKAKMPSGKGTWPAIWLLPTDWEYGGWPASGEIDIMEHVGYDMHNIHGTVHTSAYNHLNGTQRGGSKKLSAVDEQFHVYAIEWTETQIDWFIDGVKYYTFTKEADSYKVWPFDKRFHLILNIAIGGNWGGVEGIDNTIFPTEMVIDYVRVYQSFTKLEISGIDAVSANEQDLEFSCEYIPDVVYDWSMPEDATIVSGQGTHKIKVDWGSAAGKVKVKTNDDEDCADLEGEFDVSISFAPIVDKFIIDDFEGNSFGVFIKNENISQKITDGKVELISSVKGEKLIFEFNETLNITNLPLLKVAYYANGINTNLAAVLLVDENGNKSQIIKVNIEPQGQTNWLHVGADFSPSDNDLNTKIIKQLQFNFIEPNKKLIIDEIAFYSTKNAPLAPQNPQLIKQGD